MGAGVSGWRLARAVSEKGQLGVVSGTALDLILARRLQKGDPGGHMRRALEAFPDPDIARHIVDRYFLPDGKPDDKPFAAKPMVGNRPSHEARELLVAANFVEVYLAKEGHDGMVGINYLNKIQSPLPASLYGAMLAGVDVVLVGAGIPLELPGMIDRLSRAEPVELKLHVHDATAGSGHSIHFDPADTLSAPPLPRARPLFFPIVASATLASMLVKKCGGKVDGLIIEGASAGGHNAPPRGPMKLNERGEPVYGPRDEIDAAAIKALGLPFWLAGSYGKPEKLQEALAAGAAGIQVGTLFAFCEESGLREDLKREAIGNCRRGEVDVFTDPVASPTGFPFKLLSISGTLTEPGIYRERRRQCDLGYLREAYERQDGSVGWRCPAEDPQTYVRHGGALDDTVGRRCICNALMANIGLAQVRGEGGEELPLLTCGNDLSCIVEALRSDSTSYKASEAIDFLLLAPEDAPEAATSTADATAGG